MAIILKHRPEWAIHSWREPNANWAYEDETQKCIIVDLGSLFASQRVPTLALQANVIVQIRETLSQLIPVGQLYVGSEIVLRFDELESRLIQNKFFRDDIYIRHVFMDVVFAWALKEINE